MRKAIESANRFKERPAVLEFRGAEDTGDKKNRANMDEFEHRTDACVGELVFFSCREMAFVYEQWQIAQSEKDPLLALKLAAEIKSTKGTGAIGPGSCPPHRSTTSWKPHLVR